METRYLSRNMSQTTIQISDYYFISTADQNNQRSRILKSQRRAQEIACVPNHRRVHVAPARRHHAPVDANAAAQPITGSSSTAPFVRSVAQISSQASRFAASTTCSREAFASSSATLVDGGKEMDRTARSRFFTSSKLISGRRIRATSDET